MDFLLIAYDATDAEAPGRRLSVRAQHLEQARQLKAAGHFIAGGAILNDQQQMIGSTMYLRFDARQALDAYLATDPYQLHGVWERTEIIPIRLVNL